MFAMYLSGNESQKTFIANHKAGGGAILHSLIIHPLAPSGFLVMSKDPAFLFYSSDWITGTSILSFEDRGKFITIISFMHQHGGSLTEESIRLLVGSVSVNLKSKFIVSGEIWRNERLDKEMEKRRKFVESRENNGKLGGRPKAVGLPIANRKGNLLEDVNEDVNTSVVEVVKMPFASENFKAEWQRWKEYKKAHYRFSYRSHDSEQTALNLLAKNSGNNETVAIQTINESIANGWKGLIFNKQTNGAKTKDRIGSDFSQKL